jgi:hypothetical protein
MIASQSMNKSCMRLFLLLFFPLFTVGQKNCTGFVVDKSTGNRIPYATIGLIKQNRGVSANEQGAFSISAEIPKVDSLRISSVGYETLVLPVSGWINGKNVELQQQAGILNKVVIFTKKPKLYTLNRFSNCSLNWYWIALETIYQRAQRFEVPEEGMRLSELELCKDPSDCIFRIRIYDIDSSCQCPSKDLSDTIIEIRSKESHVRIDLEKYNVIIPGKSFFVAIEWLFIPFNEDIQTVKENRRKVDRTFYKPAMRYVRNGNIDKANVWELNFNGVWSEVQRYEWNYNYQITAKLR